MAEFVITTAGLAAAIDAGNRGLSLELATLVVGSGRYAAAADRTAIQTELARVSLAAGAVSGSQISLTALITAGAWTAYEVGVLDSTGTLFAVASSVAPAAALLTKTANVNLSVSVTLLLTGVPSGVVTVSPDIRVTVDNATETQRGIIEIADNPEIDAGTDDERAVTPAKLERRLGNLSIPVVLNATTTRRGIAEQATVTEARAGVDSQRFVTAEGVRRHGDDRYVRKTDPRGGVGGRRDGATNNYVVANIDDGKTIEVDASGGARMVTLPDLAAGDNGFTVTVIKTDASANAVTVDGHSADLINAGATYVLQTQWESVIAKWTGAKWIAIGGASTAWVRGRLAGLGDVRQTWLYYNANGLAPVSAIAGSPITLPQPLTSFRTLVFHIEFVFSSGPPLVTNGWQVVSLAASRIPSSYQIQSNLRLDSETSGRQFYIWAPNSNEIRVRVNSVAGAASLRLTGIIGLA